MPANTGPLIFPLLCGGIFALVSAGLGVFFIVFSLRSQKKAVESQSWPSTSGQVIKAILRKSEGVEDEDGHTHPLYYPLVDYEYTVNGQVYTSNRLSFGSRKTFNRQNQAAEELDRYPIGKQVVVHYNPVQPAEAVLETKQVIGSQLSMILGVVCLLISVCILCPLALSLVRSLSAS